MTKEEFIALGVSDELTDACAKASEKELAGYVPKQELKIAKQELKIAQQAKETLELQVKENAKQMNNLKKSVGDTEKLTQTIADLQESNKKAKADYESQLKELRISYAIDSALADAKAKNITAVKALLDMDTIELGENGKIKGLDSQIKKLTESDDTAFLFDTATHPDPKGGKPKVGKDGKNPNDGDDGGNGSSKNPNDGDDGGNGSSKKSSIGATFAKAYNSLFAPKSAGNNFNGGPNDGGKGE